MANNKITQEQYNKAMNDRNEYEKAYQLMSQEQARVKGEIEVLKSSDEYKTMQFINQFTDDENGVESEQVNGVTVYTVYAQGKEYTVANAEQAQAIKRSIAIYKAEKGATLAKYATLDEIDRNKTYTAVGAKNIGDYGQKMFGVSVGTITDYLATLRTFYDCENGYTPKHPFFKGVSITNLKQAKGTYNDIGHDVFIQKMIDGEIVLSASLSDLKKQLNALGNELPPTGEQGKETLPENESTNIGNANHSAENGAGGEVHATNEVDTPQAQARFYSKKLMDCLLEMANSEQEKQQVLTVIDMITGLIR